MKIFNLLVLIFLSISFTVAQEDMKIGEWRAHLPYNRAISITQDADKLYFTTNWSLYTIDKDDGQTEFFSKVDGLSDVGVNLVKHDPFNDAILLFYTNSNLDVIGNDGIINLPFISTSSIVGDKQVYDVFVDSETETYLAMGFGMKVLNVRDLEFGDELKAGIKFNSISVYNNFIYAGSDEGIYRIERTPSANIQDFGEWELLSGTNGFPMDYQTTNMVVYEGKLYFDIDNTLMRYDGVSLDSIYEEADFSIEFLTAEGERLLVGLACCIPSSDCNCDEECDNNCDGKVFYFADDGTYLESLNDCVDRTNFALEDEEGQIWFADARRVLRKAPNYTTSCTDFFTYNSPLTEAVSEIKIVNNQVLVSTNLSALDPVFLGDGFFTFIDGEWTNYNLIGNDNDPVMSGMVGFVTGAINPTNNNIYAGTLWDGLVEVVDGVPVNRYNASSGNSTLQFSSGDGNRVRVTGLAFDEDDNLWMGNHTAPNPISVLKNDGTWTNNFINPSNTRLRFLTIDGAGYKWFSIDGSSQALFVYDDGGTIDDKSDDRTKVFSSANSVLETNLVFSFATDLDGDVWVGTNEGIVIFECGSNVFDPSCQGSKRTVEVDGFNTFLLSSQEVKAIAVDGANRKWAGTNNGLFLLSADGRDQIAFFDTENSPLFDNRITALGVNKETGEVFIGTAKGLVSYRSDAIEGGRVNSSDAYAYPNPVRPDYDGPIAIKGLARDANVKITDVNGQLVFETTALGGQAIWDGKDYNGRKANSGVYLVFSTSTSNLENPDAIVTKILLMN